MSTAKLLTLSPKERVLSSAEIEHYFEASTVVQHANRTAAEIVAQAHSDAQDLKTQAFEQGTREAQEHVALQIGTIACAYSNIVGQMQDQVAQTAVELLKHLVGECFEHDALMERANLAARLLYGDQVLSLRVHPDRVGWASACLRAPSFNELESKALLHGCSVYGDPKLNLADVVIEIKGGAVHVALQAQIENVRAGLERALATQRELLNNPVAMAAGG